MRTQRLFSTVRLFATVAILLGLATMAIPGSQAAEPLPQLVTHQHWNFYQGPLTENGEGKAGEAAYKNPPSPICSLPTSTDVNVNTDCEGLAPHNESSIAVNPTNPLNIIGSLNDYELKTNAGGRINETAFSRAHVTFDGGMTWTTYPIYYRGYVATGDPGVAFDADGRAYLSTVGFVWSQGNGGITNPDILVATSTDGGVSWSKVVRVTSGTGSFNSPGIFNDKPYITAWGSGNAIVTWTIFNIGRRGRYINSPIYASVTHDGGRSWSTPTLISGSASFCIGAQGGNACNQSQGSVPVVAADGSIYVSFFSLESLDTGRDQYLVVKLDQDGQLVAGPFKVAGLYDGYTDYPIAGGSQTYQDSQFRTWAFGNIAADPTDAGHLAVIWSDMRNSTLPAPTNPYSATTNSDVIVSQSFDGGQSWSAPLAILLAGDQFMPWGVYDVNGLLRIGFFDRSYDPANHMYGYTLASEVGAGTLSFDLVQASDTLSDPTMGDRWFSGVTPNPDYPHPTTFLGDYSNIAASPTGVVAYWTDLRNVVTFGTRTGTGEDGYYAAMP